MRYFIFPQKDTTLYEEHPNRNTGFDEVLEVGKTNEGRDSVRFLIQFDTPNNIPVDANYDLVLYISNAERVSRNQKLEVWPVSQSWDEGTGYFYQEVISNGDGATWSSSFSGSGFWNGGTVIGSTPLTSSLPYPVADVSIDVTDIVHQWISGTISNNGLLIKFPTEDEGDLTNKGNIKFFSYQTHTIFKPALVAKWDDQTYITGSQSWPTSSLFVKPIIEPVYRENELVRVELSVRERYPQKTFDNVFTRYDGNHYLPSSSYFSIVDDLSGTTIIPFSEESKISTDGNRSYFTFRVQNMYPLRYYRILVKVNHDGLEEVFDDNTVFLVK